LTPTKAWAKALARARLLFRRQHNLSKVCAVVDHLAMQFRHLLSRESQSDAAVVEPAVPLSRVHSMVAQRCQIPWQRQTVANNRVTLPRANPKRTHTTNLVIESESVMEALSTKRAVVDCAASPAAMDSFEG
jgi:hypothetical protein